MQRLESSTCSPEIPGQSEGHERAAGGVLTGTGNGQRVSSPCPSAGPASPAGAASLGGAVCFVLPDVEQAATPMSNTMGTSIQRMWSILPMVLLDAALTCSFARAKLPLVKVIVFGATGMIGRVTFDYAMAAGRVLARRNPTMTFVFISGGGTDSSEKGGSMWARVKGKTENALLALPFKASFMFRPAMIIPMHGIVSRTRLYRVLYTVIGPLHPLLKLVAPSIVTTTDNVAKAMLLVATSGAKKHVLENRDINELVAKAPSSAP
jgi:hypothetical protein